MRRRLGVSRKAYRLKIVFINSCFDYFMAIETSFFAFGTRAHGRTLLQKQLEQY
ncbi:MAG: hypothetical protein WC814_00070 [Candidatus Paceibacterota bacterium]|jgi:hypothetical protein